MSSPDTIAVIELPLDEVRLDLRANHFEDAKTVAGLYCFFDYL